MPDFFFHDTRGIFLTLIQLDKNIRNKATMCLDICDRHSFIERQILTHLILFYEKQLNNSSVKEIYIYIFLIRNDAKYSFVVDKEYLWLGMLSIGSWVV